MHAGGHDSWGNGHYPNVADHQCCAEGQGRQDRGAACRRPSSHAAPEHVRIPPLPSPSSRCCSPTRQKTTSCAAACVRLRSACECAAAEWASAGAGCADGEAQQSEGVCTLWALSLWRCHSRNGLCARCTIPWTALPQAGRSAPASSPPTWSRSTSHRRGVAHRCARLKRAAPRDAVLTHPQILVCGPLPMIKFACRPAFEKLGFTEDQLLIW